MAEYYDFDAALKRVREFPGPSGTPMTYRAEKYFTDLTEATQYSDSIRGIELYIDVKSPVQTEQPGVWAVFALKNWPPRE